MRAADVLHMPGEQVSFVHVQLAFENTCIGSMADGNENALHVQYCFTAISGVFEA